MCAIPPTVGMHCNYSPNGKDQYDLTVTGVFGNSVNGTYNDSTSHNVTNVAHSSCCVTNTWGCPGETCIGTEAWRVLSDYRAKVPV